MQKRVGKDRDGAAPARGKAALLIERPEPGIALLTMDRADARNTLTETMLEALQEAIEAASADASVRCIVLTARGRAFSAGHDLRELTAHRADADGGRAFYKYIMAKCAGMMQAIVRSPKPVIAAVQATAVAAGCQLVATCDLAVAAADAKFGTTGINNGLFCSTPMVAVSRNMARKPAMELLLLGGLMTAEEAAARGLVNRVVESSAVLATALGLAREIAAKSPAAIAVGKRAFYRQVEQSLADAYALTADVMVENMLFDDAAEGIGAFLEKRKPDWKGRW